MEFCVKKKIESGLGRAGTITTPHGDIATPAFTVVGTKATIKALAPEQVKALGAQVVLANTYHLYLEPGESIVQEAGGLHDFMNWKGPTMTDSGGFQVFSLGEAFGTGIAKVLDEEMSEEERGKQRKHNLASRLARIDEEGVSFRSHIDGKKHRFTPEKSIEVQESIGADIIFAFDECTSPLASHEYQKEAMERTHRWGRRSLEAHKTEQALFGIVQGGRHEDLRRESARVIGGMGFDGFGIGGSFSKKDMGEAVRWVNEVLPEEKPRHLLGIGEPLDMFLAVENGCDTFDCVAPTRMGRNGSLYTKHGRINILNAQFVRDLAPIEEDCRCYTCQNYTKAYVAHLFRSKEMLAATLASIHNLFFVVELVSNMRRSICDNAFTEFKESFLQDYLAKEASFM